MDNEILSGKIRKKSLSKMLLSIPMLLVGILMLYLLYIGGLLSPKGYLKPYDVRASLKEINNIAGNAFARETVNISLKASVNDMVDTGIYKTENNATAGYYVAADVEGKYVLCYVSSKDYEKVFNNTTYTFTGAFEDTESKVKAMVLNDMAGQGIIGDKAKELLYEYTLNTQSTGVFTRTLIYCFALVPWAVSIYLLIRGLIPFLNVYAFPQVRKLSKYGPVDVLLPEIERQFTAEAENGKHKLGKGKSFTYLLDGWIAIESPLNIRFIKADEILWAYRVKHTTKMNGVITTNISYYVYFRSLDSMFSEKGDCFSIEDLLVAMALKYPWMVVGYSGKLEEIWNTDSKRFRALADETKAHAGDEGGEHSPDEAMNMGGQAQDTLPM